MTWDRVNGSWARRGWHEKGERFEGEAGGAGGSSCMYNTPKNYLTKIWGK